ncbi:SRPBCC family protein [Nonomuraea sp. SBT364]|uniref:SRPBCC family protein n=1 Tax=Nonomuraea sp. SBT364 TaxID=1580530 RepID=UPI00066D8F59|nr:SRPBCC domain-containing protein [Nonomuraea sp. SBT364]
MGHAFELPHEALVEATPEQVWEAIATGPGIDAWFMGRNEVAGGVVRTAFGGVDLPDSAVSAAEPPHRFTHAGAPAPDGRFVAYDFLVEGRDRGSTSIRLVASGFLPGDDWESEYEAMSTGFALFFATLVEYLTHFAGRAATPVTEFGPPVTDWPRAWRTLYGELGDPSPGDKVFLEPAGQAGVVYFANVQTLGVRTGDGLYRFIQGRGGSMVASHHLFGAPGAPGDAGPAWRAWLERLYG